MYGLSATPSFTKLWGTFVGSGNSNPCRDDDGGAVCGDVEMDRVRGRRAVTGPGAASASVCSSR